MSNGLIARALLELLVKENESVHKRCLQALSWLDGSPSQRTDTKEPPNTKPRSYTSRSEAVESPPSTVSLEGGIDSWLTAQSSPATNWFVLQGSAADRLMASLADAIQITTNQVMESYPGAYEIRGLWRLRPGVEVVITFPATFNPDDPAARAVLSVSHRTRKRLFELPAQSILASLNRVLREFIEAHE